MSSWNADAAEWYAEKYGEYATNRLTVALLDLQAHDVVVDVGCGAGPALRAAASKVTSGRLIGIDPVGRMLEIARERAVGHDAEERLEFAKGSAEDIPVDDDTADWVFAFDSYDHWEDKVVGFEEVKRVLKPTGTLVVVKDGGVPGTKDGFASEAEAAGFVVDDARKVDDDEEGVSFLLWLCRQGEKT